MALACSGFEEGLVLLKGQRDGGWPSRGTAPSLSSCLLPPSLPTFFLSVQTLSFCVIQVTLYKTSCLLHVSGSSVCDWLAICHLEFLQFIDPARLKEKQPEGFALTSSQWTTFQPLALLFHLSPSALDTRPPGRGNTRKKTTISW